MCGRLNVINDPLAQWVSQVLDLDFRTSTNTDLRPTEHIDTVVSMEGRCLQLGGRWGIKPAWSKKLIINAQGETAAEKKTFREAFAKRRCLVPCTGWYEWRDEGGPKKQKYGFTHSKSDPFFMAGLYFENELGTELVTLTTEPNEKCSEIHKRMPVLIEPANARRWLTGSPRSIQPLLCALDSDIINVSS